jgi:hypothetical protein
MCFRNSSLHVKILQPLVGNKPLRSRQSTQEGYRKARRAEVGGVFQFIAALKKNLKFVKPTERRA